MEGKDEEEHERVRELKKEYKNGIEWMKRMRRSMRERELQREFKNVSFDNKDTSKANQVKTNKAGYTAARCVLLVMSLLASYLVALP